MDGPQPLERVRAFVTILRKHLWADGERFFIVGNGAFSLPDQFVQLSPAHVRLYMPGMLRDASL